MVNGHRSVVLKLLEAGELEANRGNCVDSWVCSVAVAQVPTGICEMQQVCPLVLSQLASTASSLFHPHCQGETPLLIAERRAQCRAQDRPGDMGASVPWLQMPAVACGKKSLSRSRQPRSSETSPRCWAARRARQRQRQHRKTKSLADCRQNIQRRSQVGGKFPSVRRARLQWNQGIIVFRFCRTVLVSPWPATDFGERLRSFW